jgi:hypothetical protein
MFDKFELCEPGKLPEPIDPSVIGNKISFGVIIGPNRRSSASTRSQSEGIDPQEFMTFTVGDNDLILIGYVRFRDIFDRKHITGFSLRLNKRDCRFLFDGDEGYNYTREENA